MTGGFCRQTDFGVRIDLYGKCEPLKTVGSRKGLMSFSGVMPIEFAYANGEPSTELVALELFRRGGRRHYVSAETQVKAGDLLWH